MKKLAVRIIAFVALSTLAVLYIRGLGNAPQKQPDNSSTLSKAPVAGSAQEESSPSMILKPRSAMKLAQPTQGQARSFDKLVLLGLLNNGGEDVAFVQNTETKEVQKVTKRS